MAGVTEVNNSNEKTIIQIRKRDGRIVEFNQNKISNAIYRALIAMGKSEYQLAEKLSNKVMQKMVQQRYGACPGRRSFGTDGDASADRSRARSAVASL